MDENLIAALSAGNESARLNAALKIGSYPDPELADTLLARCAVEPDFYVRDMLTWALTRLPAAVTVPKLLTELHSETAQARSQALHTLSKIRDSRAWPAITKSLLRDADDEVARSAWRAAVVLVPDRDRKALARELATQFGRGEREMQLSLSRALVALGEDAIASAIRKARKSSDEIVRAHADATVRLLRDPDAGFELSLDQAKRRYVLGK